MSFSGGGLLRSAEPPPFAADARLSSRLRIALRVRPASTDQHGPARILSLSSDPHSRDLTVGQEGASLVLRLHTMGGLMETSVPGVLAGGKIVDITVDVSPERLRIAAGGRVHVEPLPPRPLSAWAARFPVLLGNELTGDRPWQGEIRRAEIATPNHHVDLLAPGLLLRPRLLWHLHRPVKLVPFRNTDPRDAFINVAGFVPLGLLLARRRWGGALAAVVGVSLTIECAQLFLPDRVPSVTDLLLNAFGGALGIAAGRKLPS